jgi:hypothetical protein
VSCCRPPVTKTRRDDFGDDSFREGFEILVRALNEEGQGETVLSTHDITDPSELPAELLALMANWSFPALQQAGVRYTWDGEQSIGMLERSIPTDQLVSD